MIMHRFLEALQAGDAETAQFILEESSPKKNQNNLEISFIFSLIHDIILGGRGRYSEPTRICCWG
jgi:hypothetical protein